MSCALSYFILTVYPPCIGGLDSRLYQDDAVEILQKLILVKDKYEIFGLLLKVPQLSPQRQHSDPQDGLLQVIDEFLKGTDPRPTWKVIINVLRHPLLQYHELAMKIERKYAGEG